MLFLLSPASTNFLTPQLLQGFFTSLPRPEAQLLQTSFQVEWAVPGSLYLLLLPHPFQVLQGSRGKAEDPSPLFIRRWEGEGVKQSCWILDCSSLSFSKNSIGSLSFLPAFSTTYLSKHYYLNLLLQSDMRTLFN